MFKISKKILLPALAFASLLSVTVRAEEPAPAAAPAGPPKPAWLTACDAEVKKLCDAENKSGGDVRPCLANHEADLSQGCKDGFLGKYRIVELCKDDFAKVCAGATGKALSDCINDGEKQKQLSDKCKSALRQGTKEHKAEVAAKTEPAPAAAAKPAKGKGKKKKAAK
jgi:hypothetical protein